MNANFVSSVENCVKGFKEDLKYQIESVSAWRYGKSIKHPDDYRNENAVRYFENFVKTLDDVPDQIILQLKAISDREEYEEDRIFSDTLSAQLQSVGFHIFPTDAKTFCEALLSRLS